MTKTACRRDRGRHVGTGRWVAACGRLARRIAAADAALLALKPDNLSMREATALPLVVITALGGTG